MADLISNFYIHPKLKQPVRFIIGGDYEVLTIGNKQNKVTYQMEVWNSDMTEKINPRPKEQMKTYVDNSEVRESWKNTLLANLIQVGYSTLGDAITGSIFKAILKRQGITAEMEVEVG